MNRIKPYTYGLLTAAMLGIALFNVASSYWSACKTGSAAWSACGIYTALSAWGVPLFTAGIGTAYLTEGTYSAGFIVKKRLPRALLGCLIWWVVCTLVMMKYTRPNEPDFDTFFECMGRVLNAPYNISLLQLAAVFFAFYPLLKRIADNEKLTRYAVIVFFVFSAAVPAIQYIPYVNVVNLFLNQINWGFFTAYGLYLFLGLYLLRRPFAWHERTVIYCLGVLGTVAMYCCTVFISGSGKGFKDAFVGVNSPFTVMQTAALIVLIKHTIGRRQRLLDNAFTQAASRAAYAFVPLISAAQLMLTQVLSLKPEPQALTVPLYALLFWLCAAVTAGVIRRIPVLSYFSC